MNIFKLFSKKTSAPKLGDFGYTYGFHDQDFIRMHFPDGKASIEEGRLAWIDFGQPICGDRLYLNPVSKKLIAKWRKEVPGAFPIYDVGTLEFCKLATPADNAEIKEYLFTYLKPEFANQKYQTWLKRLGIVDVSA